MLRPTKHVTELIDSNKVWKHQLSLGKVKKQKTMDEILSMNQVYLTEYRDLLDEFRKFKKYINDK